MQRLQRNTSFRKNPYVVVSPRLNCISSVHRFVLQFFRQVCRRAGMVRDSVRWRGGKSHSFLGVRQRWRHWWGMPLSQWSVVRHIYPNDSIVIGKTSMQSQCTYCWGNFRWSLVLPQLLPVLAPSVSFIVCAVISKYVPVDNDVIKFRLSSTDIFIMLPLCPPRSYSSNSKSIGKGNHINLKSIFKSL